MAFEKNAMGNAEADYVFEQGFGKMGIMNDEIYYDPIHGIDKRIEMGKAYVQTLITKAPSISSTTGGTVTVYGLMPSFIDPQIVDRTVRETPLVRMTPRKAVRGRSYVYNALTAKNGAAFLGDEAPLAEDVDTRTATSTTMKYLYAVGRITGPALASGLGHINLLAEDLRVKTASMNEALENEIINGAVATNANGFDGLRAAITTNAPSSAGAAITLDNLRTDFNTSFEANGLIDLVVTDGSTFNVIKGLLMDFQRNVEQPSGLMNFGIPAAFMFNGALFIKDRYMPTAAGSHEILYLDTRYFFLAVLQDMTFEELAKANNDSNKYYLKWYGALIVNFEATMVQRTSIA